MDYSSNAGLYSSLAVDNTGPHMGYYDRDATIFKYAEVDDAAPGGCGEYGSDWFRCDYAADGTKIGSSVATGIGYNNYPRLAYYDRAYPALHYATLNPTWSSILIEGDYGTNDIGRYASLAFSPATGYARIAYMDVSNGYLKYARSYLPLIQTVIVDRVTPGAVTMSNTSVHKGSGYPWRSHPMARL